MLLAAHALGDEAKGTKLAIGGAPVEGSVIRSLSITDLEKGLTVTNNGEAATDAVVTVIGASLTAEPPVSKGFKIERSYYTFDGKPVDLSKITSGTGGELRQNDRLVVVLKLESDEDSGRVLLVDRLPAGLEIENPHLVDSGDIKTLDWLKSTLRPEHTEFRDDRFVAAFNLSGNTSSSSDSEESDSSASTDDTPKEADPNAPAASATVAYIVRAITPGKFVYPAATVEDMYRPERYARTASGKLTVSAQE